MTGPMIGNTIAAMAHTVRILMVIFAAPLVFQLIGRLR
jgi:uncharacterized membrane protein AbrB (regulator of aidB expression)